MKKHGGGRIINITTVGAKQPGASTMPTTMSRAAGLVLTKSLSKEFAADNILVNAVLPSTIDTPANRVAMPNADHSKWPKPAEIAETIAFLASRESSLTTGALVPVFGRA